MKQAFLFAFLFILQMAQAQKPSDKLVLDPLGHLNLQPLPDEATLSVACEQHEIEEDLLSYKVGVDSAGSPTFVVYMQLQALTVEYDSANDVQQWQNNYTGVILLEASTTVPNDCGKGYVHRFQLYVRPSTAQWYITFESPCDGAVINLGEQWLETAFEYKPKAKK